MKRFILKRLTIAFTVLLCLIQPLILFSKSTYDVRFRPSDQTLSIQSVKTALSVLLKVIEKQTGCKFFLFRNQDDIVSASFSNLSFEKAIRKIAKNYSVAAIYQIEKTADDTRKISKVKEIWLFRSNNAEPTISMAESLKKKEMVPSPAYTEHLVDHQTDLLTEKPEKQTSQAELKKLNQPFFLNENVKYWAGRLFESVTYEDKTQCITELNRIGSDDALAAITTTLGDTDDTVRQYAVESLKSMENEGVRQILGQAFLGDKDTNVKKKALEYFLDQTNAFSRAMLKTALKDEDPEIRQLAKEALESL